MPYHPLQDPYPVAKVESRLPQSEIDKRSSGLRALLKTYMRRVMDSESMSYIEHCPCGGTEFTPKEYQILNEIYEEIIQEDYSN